MYGAIAGDVIGSPYEHRRVGTRDFALFHPHGTWTDDTVLSLAVAEAILRSRPYGEVIRQFAQLYPDAGYGGSFLRWIQERDALPYGSWGNGSAMRAPAIGYAFNSLPEVIRQAERSAIPTHDHPEGIKGAQAVAACVFLARKATSKDRIRQFVESEFDYNLSRSLAEIRPAYRFDVSCQGSVPEAILCFLESSSWEDAIRNAIYLGGDSDTLGCMAGAIAEAWYGSIPDVVATRVVAALPEHLRAVASRFRSRFGPRPDARTPQHVVGLLETNEPTLILEESELSEPPAAESGSTDLESDYFAQNVGFMPSEDTDFSALKPVDVEEVDGDKSDSEVVPMEDVYSSEAQAVREERRERMRSEHKWFHDNGTEVTGAKHLAISSRPMAISFAELLSSRISAEICIPDYLLFLDVFNVYKSYRFFVETADTLHVDLNGWSKEEVAIATIDAGGAVDRKEVLNTDHMSLWLLNAVFWSDHVRKSVWYTRDTDWAMILIGGRMAVDSVRYLDPGRGAP